VYFGQGIMGNQEAQSVLKENGADMFRLRIEADEN
jgi:hypothetical protein